MDATIRIDLNIQKQLKLKSVELGITQKELANTYILKGLNEEKSNGTLKSIKDIAQGLNIEINDVDDVLDDVIEGEYEILSEQKHLTMDEIEQIIDSNKSNEESNVKLTDILGIVESPQKTDSLEEKWESYDRR